MTRLRIAAAARDDLREIRIYSKSTFGAAVARAYMAGLRQTFSKLRERPCAGIAEGHLAADMRSIPYRSHRIYFRASSDDVLIVRILHHARDVSRQLSPR